MQPSHSPAAVSVSFDDPNLVSDAGLLPIVRLAQAAGLQALGDEHLSVPTDKGAHAGLKITSLVAGMVVGADSIDDMARLRHGGMKKLFTQIYAPSTLGSFLRKFTFGHVRQLDAVASRFLAALAGLTWVLENPQQSGVGTGYALLDVDDTIVEVHGHKKQGAGFGYSKVRGLNACHVGHRDFGSDYRGAAATQRFLWFSQGRESVDRGCGETGTASSTGRDAGVGKNGLGLLEPAFTLGCDPGRSEGLSHHQMSSTIKAAIEGIDEQAWSPIKYTDAIFDEDSKQWISKAEVAEIDFTAFASQKKSEQIPGRLVVRRIPDFNAAKKAAAGQDGLFDAWRFHAFFTTADPELLDTVTADTTHRAHATIEQVNADLKASALAHLPSGIFTANAAWLVLAVMAFNVTRAAATLTATELAKATTATIRRKLITVPARIASSARRIVLHLPTDWPWEKAWTNLFNRVNDPPAAATA